MIRLTVPPTTWQRPTNPIPSEIEVQEGRVHNPPAPLPALHVPSLNGDPRGRPWGNWAARQLLGGGSSLYIGIPTLEQADDGTWFVAHEYLKTGSRSETAMVKYPAKPQHGGERGDAMLCGNITPIGIANQEGQSLWLGIDPGGTLWHMTHNRLLALCGPTLLDDTVIRPSGAGKTVLGTFDRPFFNPNDVVLDESLIPSGASGTPFMKTVCFIADSGTVTQPTGRIAKVEHTMAGTPSERHMEVTTYAELPGLLPYGLCRWPDGVLVVVLRATGQVVAVKPNGTWTEIAGGFTEPFRCDLFSDGSVLVSEWGRKQIEVSPTGVKRDQGRQPHGENAFYEVYIDRFGAQGPVDDFINMAYSSYRYIQRRGRTDGYGNFGDPVIKDGSWLVTGSYSIRQGMLKYIQEVDWHYGWTIAGSPREAKLLMTGDAGSSGATELYMPTDEQKVAFLQFDTALYQRGAAVWKAGTTPESGVLRPSGRLTMGPYGQNFVHGYTFEQLADKTTHDFGEWARAGMGTLTPRPELTEADCRALHYYAYCHTRYAQAGLSPSLLGAGPTLPPIPPPDTVGPTLTVTGWPTVPTHTVALTVAAADPSGVAFVALFVDGEEVARDAGMPYVLEYEFPPEAVPGPHGFVVVGEDTTGNRTVLPAVTVEKPEPPPPAEDREFTINGQVYRVVEA